MKKKILVSVVIPAYNEEKNIGSCLTAFKNQDFSHQNFEIIVVDNNSTDKTAQIAQKMGAKVILEKTQGYVFALRKGCSQAEGEIIAITDADTLVPGEWLKKIYQAYQKNPQVVCVAGKVTFKPKILLAFLIEPLFALGGWFFNLFPGMNLSIRKDVYRKIGGFRKEINFDTDVDLCLRIRKEGKMLFLWDNPVVTSSRHFRGIKGIIYCLKGAVNITSLILFAKAPFFQFGDVREE